MSDITILTATLGRASLSGVAACIRAQTYESNWLVVYDGPEAFLKAAPLVLGENNPNWTGIPIEPVGNNWPMYFSVVDQIKTPYVAFMDDDNEFNSRHIETLVSALKRGIYCPATLRLYCDEEMRVISKEHVNSEVVDTNNFAMRTETLVAAAHYYKDQRITDRFPNDRHIQAFLFSQGIGIKRIQKYTVKYKMNPTYCQVAPRVGKITYETLLNRVILTDAGPGELAVTEELYVSGA